jgi:hypothetical protein
VIDEKSLKIDPFRGKCARMRMRNPKWILMVVLLVVSAVCIFIDFFLYGNAQQAHAQPAPNAQQVPVVGSAPLSRSPHFISVRMKKPLETLW